jgi:hypothetical protein
MENDFQGYFDNVDNADVTVAQGAAIGGALGTVVPGVGNVIGAAVGGGVVAVTGAVSNLIKSGKAKPTSVADQNTLLNMRNQLLIGQPTYNDIVNYNTTIWNDFQHLDQAKAQDGGHDCYEYFIYFTNDKTKFDKKCTYTTVSNRGILPSANGKTGTNICPQSEMFFFSSKANRNVLNWTSSLDMSFNQPVLPSSPVNITASMAEPTIRDYVAPVSAPSNAGGSVVSSSNSGGQVITSNGTIFGLSTTNVVIIAAAIIGIIIFALRK